jgi:hypothetical protein
MSDDSDIQAVNATVQDYFEGMHHHDMSRLRKAFHPATCLTGHFRGPFVHLTLAQWLQSMDGKPSPASKGDLFDMQVLSVDLTGEVGIVKVLDVYRGMRYTDYLSVARVDSRWVIVNKTFHHD